MASTATSGQAKHDPGYRWEDADRNDSHDYLLPAVKRILASLRLSQERRRILDLGCGNGAVAAHLASQGYDLVGIDPSEAGIAQGRKAYPQLQLHHGSCYDDLSGQYGRFPVVLSLEVVEHVYFPRQFAASAYALLEDGGTAIISTPYHSYLKNLVLGLTGKMDAHFTALWDHGHIKFWSIRTLTQLLTDAGFKTVRFERVGRIPPLAKSMIAVATR
jgi:2-polyprenyl-6-hydroxyphenyl methylase/3-demethylubiquinone-9 3-methyltransferase